MRLGQLARKLEVNPGRLMEVLKDLSIETDRGLNTSLDDSKIKRIEERLIEEPEDERSSEVASDAQIDVPPIEEVQTEKKETKNIEKEVGTSEIVDEPPIPLEEEPQVELIKAPKVQLPGLKVVGKIDLPEPVKKEPKEEKEKEEKREVRKVVRPERKSWDKSKKPRDNRPTAYEERKKKEEKENRREKEIRQLELKKKKQQHYKKNVQPKPKATTSPKPIIIKEEKKPDLGPPTPKSEPTSLMGKFWRWLNT